MEKLSTRCCIAGGGPAGIMLGYLLARSGIAVVVLEKWPDFFRDFRGDTIHPSSMEILHELGLLARFLKLPQTPTHRIEAHIGGESLILADFAGLAVAAPFVAMIPQWDFLNFMVEEGRIYPDFRVLMETEAIDLIKEQGRVTGVRAMSPHGAIEIHADLVIGADGRHSTVRAKAGLERDDLGAPIDVLWFRLAREQRAGMESFGYVRDDKFMVTINRNTYWQCAFVIAKGDFENFKRRGIDFFRTEIGRVAPSLSKAAEEIKSWDDVKLLSVAVDHLRQWYAPGVLCIGDSAHAMSPVGGVGINLAIQDAVAAANILIPAFRAGVPAPADLAKVQARRSPPARKTQRLQVFVHTHLLAPILSGRYRVRRLPWFMRVIKWFPGLRRIPARTIGMGFRPEHVENI